MKAQNSKTLQNHLQLWQMLYYWIFDKFGKIWKTVNVFASCKQEEM